MAINSYIVTIKDNADVNSVANEIQSLAEKENKKVYIGSKLDLAGILQMTCKADFAAAVGKLPSVLAVENELTQYIQKPKRRPAL